MVLADLRWKLFVWAIVFMFPGLHGSALASPVLSSYSLDEAIAKGVVNARMSLFSATDQKHVLDSIAGIDSGIIYATYVGVWGTIRQQDINSAGQLAATLHQRLPRTILGGGVNESVRSPFRLKP
jgi:hypothetical protein